MGDALNENHDTAIGNGVDKGHHRFMEISVVNDALLLRDLP